jgi:hypothetical protein
VAAAKNKNRGIQKKARFKAIVESMKLYFKACLIPSLIYQFPGLYPRGVVV